MGWGLDPTDFVGQISDRERRRKQADIAARGIDATTAKRIGEMGKWFPWMSPGLTTALARAGMKPLSPEMQQIGHDVTVATQQNTAMGYRQPGEKPGPFTQEQLDAAVMLVPKIMREGARSAGQRALPVVNERLTKARENVVAHGDPAILDQFDQLPITEQQKFASFTKPKHFEAWKVEAAALGRASGEQRSFGERVLRNNPLTNEVIEPTIRAGFTGDTPVARGVRGAVRTGITPLQAPVQMVQGQYRSIAEDIRQKGWVGAFLEPNNPGVDNIFANEVAVASQTDIGQILGSISSGEKVDTGSGWFVAPDSGVAQDRRAAEVLYGGDPYGNGQVRTIGRDLASTIAEPGSKEFNIFSGIADGAVAIGTDRMLLDPVIAARLANRSWRTTDVVHGSTTTTSLTADALAATRQNLPSLTDEWIDEVLSLSDDGLKSRFDDVSTRYEEAFAAGDQAAHRALEDQASFLGWITNRHKVDNPHLITTEVFDKGQARRAMDEVMGLMRGGIRPVVHQPTIDAWIDGPQARRFAEFVAENRIAKIDDVTGNKLPPSLLKQWDESTDVDEILSSMKSVAGTVWTDKPRNTGLITSRFAGKGFEAKELLPARARRTLFGGTPSHAAYDTYDARGSLTNVERLLRTTNADTAMVDKYMRLMSTAGDHIERRTVFMQVAENIEARAIADYGVDPKNAKSITRFFEETEESARKYFVDHIGTDVNADQYMVNGELVKGPTPMDITELVERYMPALDFRKLRRVFSDPVTNAILQTSFDAEKNAGELRRVWAQTLDIQEKYWKPAAIIRGAYVLRVLGEEQLRIAAAGFSSLTKHPFGYLAYFLGDSPKTEAMVAKLGIHGRGKDDVFAGLLDEAEAFGESMFRRRGGMSDEVRLNQYTLFIRGEAGYEAAALDEIASVAASPVGRIAARLAGGFDHTPTNVIDDIPPMPPPYAGDVPPKGLGPGPSMPPPTSRFANLADPEPDPNNIGRWLARKGDENPDLKMALTAPNAEFWIDGAGPYPAREIGLQLDSWFYASKRGGSSTVQLRVDSPVRGGGEITVDISDLYDNVRDATRSDLFHRFEAAEDAPEWMRQYREGSYRHTGEGTLERVGEYMESYTAADRAAIHDALRRVDLVSDDGTVKVYRGFNTKRPNEPRGGYVNGTLDRFVAESFGDDVREYDVPVEDIMGFGNAAEEEVIFRSAPKTAAGGSGGGGVIDTRLVGEGGGGGGLVPAGGAPAGMPPPMPPPSYAPAPNPLQTLQDMVWDGPLQVYRKQFAKAKNNPRLLRREGSDEWARQWLRRVNIKAGMNEETGAAANPVLLEAMSTGRIDGVGMFEPGSPFLSKAAEKALRPYLDSMPEKVRGPKSITMPSRMRGGLKHLDDAINWMFDSMAARPANWLSRSPVFRQSYTGHMIAYAPKVADPDEMVKVLRWADNSNLSKADKARLKSVLGTTPDENWSLEVADQVSKMKALEDTKGLLYDLSDRNQFFDVFRLIFPFGEAWKEMVTTWSRLARDNPKIALTAERVIEGARNPDVGDIVGAPEGQGIFYTDANGTERFMYPLSAQSMGVLGKLPLIPNNLPEQPMVGSVAGLSLMTEVLPGAGPVMQIAAALLLPDNPEWDVIGDLIFPYGRPDNPKDIAATAMAEFVPPWAKTLFSRGFARGGVTAEGQRAFANEAMNVARHKIATGEFDVTDTLNSKAETDRLVWESKNDASWMTMIRGFSQFFAPAAPAFEWYIEVPDGRKLTMLSLVEDYREMQQEDFTTATEKFLAKYGDNAFLLMQGKSMTISPGIVAPTEEANDWMRSNEWAVDEYSKTYGFFAPTGGKFNAEAYRRQLERAERNPLEVKQFILSGNDLIGKSIYYAAREKALEAALRSGRKSLSEDQQVAMRELDQYLTDHYEGYGDEAGTVNPATPEELIDELRMAASDPRLKDQPVSSAIRDYLTVRDAVAKRVAADNHADSFFQEGTSDEARQYRAVLTGFAEELIAENPDFNVVWERVFRNELNAGLKKDTQGE